MSDLENAKSLLRLARNDFNALRGMLDNPLFSNEIFGFHAQQAVEKAFKGWLALKGVEFPLTHELKRLLSVLAANGEDISPYVDLVKYTVFAVQARYNEGYMLNETIDRRAVIEEIGAALDRIIDKFPVDRNSP